MRSDGQWLWAIVLLGAALRFFPVWFGLPYERVRPDEETAVSIAARIREGDLNPHFFHWPSLTFYAFAALFTAASWARRVAGLDPELTTAASLVLGRALVALAGTLTIVAAFKIGRRVGGQPTGLLTALFLAIAVLHVRDSHFAMTDILMTLFVTASLALLLRASDTALERSSAREALAWFAAAGAAGGLAAATKYSAAAIVVAMAAAQLALILTARRPIVSAATWAPSLAFLGAFAAGFLAGTPYAIGDFKTFERDFLFNFTHLSVGHTVDVGQGWYYHAARSLPYGLGIPMFVAAIAGLVPLVRHYPRHAAIVCSFAFALYFSIGSGRTVFFRYVLPLVPIACLSAAVAVWSLTPRLAAAARVGTAWALTGLAALVAAPALVNSIWLDVLLARTDSRVLAGQWLEERLEPGTTLHDAGGGYSKLDLRRARFHYWYFDPATRSFGHPEGRTPEWLVLHESPLASYASILPELRQLAQRDYTLIRTFTANRRWSRSAIYDPQDAFFLPISGFATMERPGPTIHVYRRLTR